MQHRGRKVNELIARLAGSAHGAVSHAELLAAGVTVGEIRRRRESGLLLLAFRGVYRVGHRAWSPEAWYCAAVKACGEGSALSGLSAGWAWALVKGQPPRPEVTCPTERRIKGIATKRSRRLARSEITTWKGIPITTVSRTLVDLAATLPFEELSYAVHQADVRHDVTAGAIEAALGRYPTARGAADLRRIVTGDAPTLLSRLEERFRALLTTNGLPLPETNRKRGAHYVDCRWPAHALTVELDSYRFHRTRRSWERDHERERAARRRGDRFRSYTWRDVVEDPAPTVAELRFLLAT